MKYRNNDAPYHPIQFETREGQLVASPGLTLLDEVALRLYVKSATPGCYYQEARDAYEMAQHFLNVRAEVSPSVKASTTVSKV